MSEEFERDRTLGTALRKLPVPEHQPPFFSELAALLQDERQKAPGLPHRPLRHRRLLVGVAAGIAIAAIAVGVLVFPRPNPALAVLMEAEDRFAESPPFRAVISAPPARFSLSYRDQAGWRFEPVEPFVDPADLSAGSYTVWDGKKLYSYTAANNTYEVTELGAKELNLIGFFIWKADGGIERWEARCGDVQGKVLPNEVVAGRDARHVMCGDFELWVDAETGLMLKITSHERLPEGVQPEPRPIGLFPGSTLEVVEIEYDPTFPEGFFEFSPPAGAKSAAEQRASLENPFNWTKLVKGEVASSWVVPKLNGGSIRLEGLRGKSSLVLLSDCNEITDGADLGSCVGYLSDFQAAFERWGDRVNFLWIGMAAPGWPEAEAADRQLRILTKLGVTFPAAIDIPFVENEHRALTQGGVQPRGVVHKAWGSDTCGCGTGTYYVLLDSGGRVIDVRIRYQYLEDLKKLLSKAER